MSTPILTDALIDRVLQEQRGVLRLPIGLGHAAWPFRAEPALATLTPEGWCHVGWIERLGQTTTRTVRYQAWWQVDTSAVGVEVDGHSRCQGPHVGYRQHDACDCTRVHVAPRVPRRVGKDAITPRGFNVGLEIRISTNVRGSALR